ncbi:MAG: UDP-N-acetylmuramate dehydrogenase [Alphaproteobacteria bacterium]
MVADQLSDRLIDRLPAVRGSYEENVPLSELTWFRVGGPAEVLFRPVDEDDLEGFLRGRRADVPVTIIGAGSNLLVRDGGVAGVVIRFGRGFAHVAVEGDRLRAGGAAADMNVAKVARDAGLSGMEFLRGVPGNIGGAVRMNAGAYGRELADVLVEATAFDLEGARHLISRDQIEFAHRYSSLQEGWVVTSAVLQGTRDAPEAIAARMEDVSEQRQASQPTKSRTGGSTFKNPDGRKAWELIDAAGCRGLVIGGAQISEQHCNFIINTGTATAADIESLGEEVRRRVLKQSGVSLEWEIRRIGIPASGDGA